MNKDDLNKIHELELELTEVKTLVEGIDEKVDAMVKNLGTIHELLYGNGDTDKSIVVRLSQVKKDMARMTWAVGIIFVLSIGMILESVFS